jgi:U4/U6 small nuclear ribonucleoprotein PRP31
MEATTTLADALLGDLDDLSDVEESNGTQEGENEVEKTSSATGNGKQEIRGASITFAKRRLLDDANLRAHLEAVRKSDSSKPSSAEARKRQEEEEHQLILQSNKHLSNLANELARAHGDLCTAYKPKFPELEELIVDPIQYQSAVRVIGNAMDLTTANEGLNEFLSSNQIITISVAGSTTSGRPLLVDELVAVDAAATYMEELVEVQQELTRFVESRMESLAPSVCALVGPSTAAVLLGLAGGLAELSKIPACNLQVLGQVKQNAASRAGMSSIASKPHTGILAECELVKSCPSYLQKKALKVVAAKLALAARCDFINVETGRPRSAASGMRFRHEVETKIASWQTPDKAPVLKALPK